MEAMFDIAVALVGFGLGGFVALRHLPRYDGRISCALRLALGSLGLLGALACLVGFAYVRENIGRWLAAPMLGIAIFVWVVGSNLFLRITIRTNRRW